jgi:hypothetical protein
MPISVSMSLISGLLLVLSKVSESCRSCSAGDAWEVLHPATRKWYPTQKKLKTQTLGAWSWATPLQAGSPPVREQC